MKSQRCPTCRRLMRRSSQANARYWLLLHLIAESIRPGGVSYSAEVWHAYMKSRFLGCDDVRLPNGRVLTIPKSSADLDTDLFGDYMTKVEAWASERNVFLDDMESAA
jgi:hypothetical protein